MVKIAGGFGLHVDPVKTLIMGMIPDCDPHQIIPIGNAAGAGALVTLLNRGKRAESDWVARMVEYVDLASLQGFKDEFVEALHIPTKKILSPTWDRFCRRRFFSRIKKQCIHTRVYFSVSPLNIVTQGSPTP